MKKRILLLIPCLLLALGLLTACGSNGSGGGQSTGELENKLVGYTWEGKAEATSGNIDVNLPFELGKLLKVQFNENGTGYISILEGDHLPNIDFRWTIQNGQIHINFDKGGYFPFTLDFSMNDQYLVLKKTGLFPIEIKLKRQ